MTKTEITGRGGTPEGDAYIFNNRSENEKGFAFRSTLQVLELGELKPRLGPHPSPKAHSKCAEVGWMVLGELVSPFPPLSAGRYSRAGSRGPTLSPTPIGPIPLRAYGKYGIGNANGRVTSTGSGAKTE